MKPGLEIVELGLRDTTADSFIVALATLLRELAHIGGDGVDGAVNFLETILEGG